MAVALVRQINQVGQAGKQEGLSFYSCEHDFCQVKTPIL